MAENTLGDTGGSQEHDKQQIEQGAEKTPFITRRRRAGSALLDLEQLAKERGLNKKDGDFFPGAVNTIGLINEIANDTGDIGFVMARTDIPICDGVSVRAVERTPTPEDSGEKPVGEYDIQVRLKGDWPRGEKEPRKDRIVDRGAIPSMESASASNIHFDRLRRMTARDVMQAIRKGVKNYGSSSPDNRRFPLKAAVGAAAVGIAGASLWVGTQLDHGVPPPDRTTDTGGSILTGEDIDARIAKALAEAGFELRQGPPGDKGDTGDKGDKGEPGPPGGINISGAEIQGGQAQTPDNAGEREWSPENRGRFFGDIMERIKEAKEMGFYFVQVGAKATTGWPEGRAIIMSLADENGRVPFLDEWGPGFAKVDPSQAEGLNNAILGEINRGKETGTIPSLKTVFDKEGGMSIHLLDGTLFRAKLDVNETLVPLEAFDQATAATRARLQSPAQPK